MPAQKTMPAKQSPDLGVEKGRTPFTRRLVDLPGPCYAAYDNLTPARCGSNRLRGEADEQKFFLSQRQTAEAWPPRVGSASCLPVSAAKTCGSTTKLSRPLLLEAYVLGSASGTPIRQVDSVKKLGQQRLPLFPFRNFAASGHSLFRSFGAFFASSS